MSSRTKARRARGAPSQPQASGWSVRVWFFRVLSIVVVPALLLGAVELVLRLAGVGYDPDFFVLREFHGKKVLTENPHFGFRFFPPGLARSPLPTVISAQKPEGTFRIFLFGESAALGDPRPAFGVGRYLEELLDSRFPNGEFEVVCVAMTAINSHVVLPIARACAAQQADMWIIYMGNNEMIGPFGACGKLGAKAPTASIVRASLMIQRTRIGQGLQALFRKLQNGPTEGVWRGLDLFTGQEIPPDAPVRARVAENFAANLESILECAKSAGVDTILCTVASSLRDCAPHASLHSMELADSTRAEWEAAYRAGLAAAQAGDFATAAARLKQAAELDGLYAAARFSLGEVQLARTNREEALEEFVAARDADALPFRTTSRLNNIIREKAAASGTPLLDLEKELNGRKEIPGLDLFFDHVHFNFDGNYLVARRLADAVIARIPSSFKQGEREEWLDQTECENLLGLTAWNRYLACENMLGRIVGPPYTNQLTNAKCRQAHGQQLRKYREEARGLGVEGARKVYVNAIGKDPEDHYLHQNFAEFLELSGNEGEAIAEWEKVQLLVPHHPAAYFHAGRLKVQQGDFSGGEAELREALSIRSDFSEAMVQLGKALAGQNEHQAAIEVLNSALRMNPANAAAHFALAETLAAMGRRDEALEELRTAVEINPAYWEAHYFLGVELAVKGDIEGALAHFQEVVRLRPEHALGHLNYGVALARQKRFSEAAHHFQETLKLDPGNEAARKHLETLQGLLGINKESR